MQNVLLPMLVVLGLMPVSYTHLDRAWMSTEAQSAHGLWFVRRK